MRKKILFFLLLSGLNQAVFSARDDIAHDRLLDLSEKVISLQNADNHNQSCPDFIIEQSDFFNNGGSRLEGFQICWEQEMNTGHIKECIPLYYIPQDTKIAKTLKQKTKIKIKKNEFVLSIFSKLGSFWDNGKDRTVKKTELKIITDERGIKKLKIDYSNKAYNSDPLFALLSKNHSVVYNHGKYIFDCERKVFEDK